MKIAKGIVPVIIVWGVIFFSQFYRLDHLAYRIFDEAHLVTSAHEMLHNGHYFSPTFENQPDMRYTKPPLMLWCMALSIKAFGLNEFAARLPSVIAATLTIWLVFFFAKRITGSTWAGVAAAVILSTSEGYIAHHGTRFGEYDGMLTLFTTAYLFSFFQFIHTEEKGKNRYLLLFFLWLTLACFTKDCWAIICISPTHLRANEQAAICYS